MLFPHSQTRSSPSFRFDLATSTFDTAISLLTSIPNLKTDHQRHNHNEARLKSATPSLQIVLDPALDERGLARHKVSSRAATVGETFACPSPAYGTNHQLHLGSTLRNSSIVVLSPPCDPNLVLRSRISLIKDLPHSDLAQHRLPTLQHSTIVYLARRKHLIAGTRSQEWIPSLHTRPPHNRPRPSPRQPPCPSQAELAS